MTTPVTSIQQITQGKQGSQGWYVAIAVTTAVVLANTKISPILFGVMVVADIFQLNKIFANKNIAKG